MKDDLRSDAEVAGDKGEPGSVREPGDAGGRGGGGEPGGGGSGDSGGPGDSGEPGDAGEDPRARAEWFLRSRSGADGRPLRGIFLEASRTRRRIERARRGERTVGDKGRSPAPLDPPDPPTPPGPPPAPPGPPGSVNWTPIGPSVISSGLVESGRVDALAVGPGGSRIYAGTDNGGLWYSADGGADWSPLDDSTVSPSVFGGASEADSLSIGALAVRFGASALADEVWVGTGQLDFSSYFGVGIRHLAGGTWSLEATNLAGQGIAALAIDPDDPTVVFAATTIGLFRRGGGGTWTLVMSPAFADPSRPASAIVVAGSGAAKTWYVAFWHLGLSQPGQVCSSPDGVAWSPVAGFSGTGRVALAASESDPTVIYALCEDGTLNRLSGGTFSAVPGLPAAALFPGNQGWYDIVVAVDPADANTIYLGGDRNQAFKGTLVPSGGGWTFPFNPANSGNPQADPTWIGKGIHPDVHVITFGLNAAGTAHDANNVWIGCDGGLYRSTSGGAGGTFQPRNLGLAVTELHSVAQRADTDAVVFTGAQDNGPLRLLGEQAAINTVGGDGCSITCDPNSAYRVLEQSPFALYASADGGGSWSPVSFPPITAPTPAQQSAAQTEYMSKLYVAPLAAVAAGATTLALFGTTRLWLSADWGGSWVTLPSGTNPYVPATPDLTQDILDSANPAFPARVAAIAVAGPARIFAAANPSSGPAILFRYDQSGAAWSKTVIPTGGLPSDFHHPVTALTVEDPVAGTLYATLGGGGVAHVHYFDGASWQVAMPLSVVDVPAHAVVADSASPGTVYVGTDVGCWRGIKGGAWSWSLFSQGLPEAAITALAIHAPSRLLRAATFGRGVWEVDLAAAPPVPDPDVYLRVNSNDSGRMSGGARFPWVEGGLDPTHYDALNPYLLYHWMSADIKVRRSSLSGLPPLSSPVNYLDFAVNIGDYVDTVVHMETGDVSGVDRVFVEVHNRSLDPVPAAQVHVLLLAVDASAGLPALPAGWAAQVNALNTSASWLAGTPWQFVDPASPYHALIGNLDVRTPQVVEYLFDFSSVPLPAGHDHVCLAAFVTTPMDPIPSIETDLNAVTMHDKHVAHRNIHLVALGAKPLVMVDGGQRGGAPGPQARTMLIDFHNPTGQEAVADLVFDRTHFPGRLSLMLPRLVSSDPSLDGFRLVRHPALDETLRHAVGEWLERAGELIEEAGEWLEAAGERLDGEDRSGERGGEASERPSGERVRERGDEVGEERRGERGGELGERERRRRRKVGKLAALDRGRLFVAEDGRRTSAVTGVRLPAGGALTVALTVEAPEGAAPGDRFRLDVVQRRGGEIAGGSSYVIVVPEPAAGP